MFAALIAGLLGGTHCIGMCGGLVSALTFALPDQSRKHVFSFQLFYNLGRIFSYALLGALVAYIGMSATSLTSMPAHVLKLISAFFIAAMALYIMNVSHILSFLEKGGQKIWKAIQPVSKHLLPINTYPKAFLYGVIWGWLPCGLVYSMLTWAAASGAPENGALIMVVFGLGTSPTLLLIGGFADKVRPVLQNRMTKLVAGMVMLVIAGYTAMDAIRSFG